MCFVCVCGGGVITACVCAHRYSAGQRPSQAGMLHPSTQTTLTDAAAAELSALSYRRTTSLQDFVAASAASHAAMQNGWVAGAQQAARCLASS